MINVLIRGEVFSKNDYGIQCRRVIRELRHREDLKVYIINTSSNDCGWIHEDNEERTYLDSVLKDTSKHIRNSINSGEEIFDVTLQVQSPSEWEDMTRTDFGVFLGSQVEDISSSWKNSMSKVDEILVLNNFQKNQLEEFNASVIGYGVDEGSTALDENILNKFNEFNFLVDAKWHPHNDIEGVVVSFIQEFMNEDVGLILRTNVKNNSHIDKFYTVEYVNNLVSMLPQNRKCKIHLLHGTLDEKQELGLSQNKNIMCMINCTHSITTPLNIVSAYNCGTPIITSATGFFTDADENTYYRVECEIKNLESRHVVNELMSIDDKWSYMDTSDLRRNMRKVYSNRGSLVNLKKTTEQDSNLLYNIIKKTISSKENKDETK